MPDADELPQRLSIVLRVIYLVFNEGYSASSGPALMRHDLSAEAIRLGRLLVELLPEPEAMGLLALMLLHESRRGARTSATGDIVLLGDQQRSLWNRESDRRRLGTRSTRRFDRVSFGPTRCRRRLRPFTPNAATAEATDWNEIVGLYDLLLTIDESPVVELNRAVAVAMRDGAAAGLVTIDAILARGDLTDYHLAHAARADLCRRLGDVASARASYERAAALVRQGPECRFLQRRLAELDA